MKIRKTILLSAIAIVSLGLITTACSNHKKASETKSSQVSKKSHSKDKSSSDNSSSSASSMTSSQKQSAAKSESKVASEENVQGKGSDKPGTNIKKAPNQTKVDNPVFDTIVNDVIKRLDYPKTTTKADFGLITSGNNNNQKIDVMEKQSGAIVAHYLVKNGTVYYQNINGAQIKVK